MKGCTPICLFSGLLALPGLAAAPQSALSGLDVAVLGAERVSVYRDLKVKNDRKEDLLVVRLEVRWTADVRHVLIEDDDLRVRDAGGKTYRCAFTFVQLSANPGDQTAVLEIPFRVRADAAIVSLQIGKDLLPIKSEPRADQ